MSSYYEKMLATGEVKCIDDEIPFEVPQGWEWCRLNDLALYRKGPFGSSLTKSMFVAKSTQSIKVYEQKNAIQKDCTLGDYYISKEKFETMQSFVVKPNDIIVSCAGTIGETYLLPSDAPVGIINQALMRVTLLDLNMVEYWQIYFAYMLLNEAQMKGSGSAIKNIPPFEYLKAVLVPIPPLSEQNRLVERYNILLSLIGKYELEANKLNCLNQKVYDKLKKSVLQEAIRGKLIPQLAEEGSAQDLLEQIKLEKQKLVKEGKLKKSALTTSTIFRGDDNKYYTINKKERISVDDEIPFDIPNTWEWCRLGILFSHSTGKALNASNLKGQLMTYITTSNLYWDRFELDNLKQMRFTDEEIEKCTATFGDLLVCEGGDIGRAAIWNYQYDIRIQNHIHKLRAYKQLCTKFFFWLFYFYKATGRIGGKGIGIQGLSSKALDNILIPLPPLKEQQRIVAQIEKLFEQLH